MKSKKVRNIKVISQSGRNYKPTPTVILKGQWMNEMGFEIGDQIKVECENGKLVISLDRERMEMLDAEKVFMEEETKKLQARFKKEKEEIHARYVAERRAAYGLPRRMFPCPSSIGNRAPRSGTRSTRS